MSVEHMACVLHHSRLRGTAKLVLLGIANHQSDNGAWPSIETLARYAGCTPRQVQRHIVAAQAAGELEVHLQDGGTHRTRADRRTNRYELLVSCPPECDGSANHRIVPVAEEPARGDAHVAPRLVDNPQRGDADDTPPGQETVNGVTLKVERGDADVTRTIREPSLLPSVSLSTTDRATTGPTDRLDSDTDEPANPDSDPSAAVTDPRLADPGFVRFLAAVAPGVRRPERFDWPGGELDALEARWRSPQPFGPQHTPPTPTPPRFDPAVHGPPSDAVPMPDYIRDALRRPA